MRFPGQISANHKGVTNNHLLRWHGWFVCDFTQFDIFYIYIYVATYSSHSTLDAVQAWRNVTPVMNVRVHEKEGGGWGLERVIPRRVTRRNATNSRDIYMMHNDHIMLTFLFSCFFRS